MILSVKINLENAAFQDGFHEEISRIFTTLKVLLDRLDYPLESGMRLTIIDYNGNSVGYLSVEGP
jgi:hypothetical protein